MVMKYVTTNSPSIGKSTDKKRKKERDRERDSEREREVNITLWIHGFKFK